MRGFQVEPGVVHVWRVSLADSATVPALRRLLSDEERARADRFVRPEHGRRFTITHGWKRRILAQYTGVDPRHLRFTEGRYGKPSLNGGGGGQSLHFNLSHSGTEALVAVARNPVGVDIEQWDPAIEHLDLAQRFFSPAEREALLALASDPAQVVAGFFACWSRKEAYLKATGYGISRGLHHFDVTLTPGLPARLLADRLDQQATSRWQLVEIEVPTGYSAALAAEAPLPRVFVQDAIEGRPGL
ncbi:MAG: 4'-phosphopantetheinyl transferase family protein [Gemmatimonadales bacterium]